MQYCKRLYDLRTDNDLTQKEVAKILNTSKQGYSNYERGTRKLSIEDLIKLADFYKVSTDYILGRTDNPEMNTKVTKQVNITNNKKSNTTINMWI